MYVCVFVGLRRSHLKVCPCYGIRETRCFSEARLSEESGEPSTVGRGLSMEIDIEQGGFREA